MEVQRILITRSTLPCNCLASISHLPCLSVRSKLFSSSESCRKFISHVPLERATPRTGSRCQYRGVLHLSFSIPPAPPADSRDLATLHHPRQKAPANKLFSRRPRAHSITAPSSCLRQRPRILAPRSPALHHCHPHMARSNIDLSQFQSSDHTPL